MAMLYRNSSLMLLALVLLVPAGCERPEPLGKVFGKVTLHGAPLSEGLLIFSNRETGVYMTANLRPDGTYELQTAKGFGLPLGSYHIAVSPPLPDLITGKTPAETPPTPPVEIPAKFRKPETSGLTIEVQMGDNPKNIDLSS